MLCLGATVTLTNLATNDVRDDYDYIGGAYTFEAVAVGDYRIEVEAAGFKKSVVTTFTPWSISRPLLTFNSKWARLLNP